MSGLISKKKQNNTPVTVQPEPVTPKPVELPTLPESDLRHKVLGIAYKEEGVKEFMVGSNKVVEKYHAYSTEDNVRGTTDDVPWCASFMCYVLEMAGLKSTNSKAARSYEKYGKPTTKPQAGDIVVFWRGSKSSGKGHVALFLGFDKNGNILCLGGNQSNSVCRATYSKDQLLGFRTYV